MRIQRQSIYSRQRVFAILGTEAKLIYKRGSCIALVPLMDLPIFQLIYTSVAESPMSGAELVDLLEKARSHNTKQGIGGVLLYGQGRFIQVLEGERVKVEALYDRITQDPRHDFVRTAMAREVAEREFPAWSMGFRDLTNKLLAQHPQVRYFFDEHFDSHAFGQDGSPARFLLLAFRDVD